MIAEEFLASWEVELDPTARELFRLTDISPGFHAVIQAFMFRHLNIRSVQKALDLLDLFDNNYRTPFNLANGIRTLQFDFDFKADEPQEEEDLKQFWIGWRHHIGSMMHLTTITLCVNVSGVHSCLGRFLRESRVRLIRSLRTLHITPSQYHWPVVRDVWSFHSAGS